MSIQKMWRNSKLPESAVDFIFDACFQGELTYSAAHLATTFARTLVDEHPDTAESVDRIFHRFDECGPIEYPFDERPVVIQCLWLAAKLESQEWFERKVVRIFDAHRDVLGSGRDASELLVYADLQIGAALDWTLSTNCPFSCLDSYMERIGFDEQLHWDVEPLIFIMIRKNFVVDAPSMVAACIVVAKTVQETSRCRRECARSLHTALVVTMTSTALDYATVYDAALALEQLCSAKPSAATPRARKRSREADSPNSVLD